MIPLALRGAALTSVGALLIIPGAPESLAMWGVFIASVAGLIKQVLDQRGARQERIDEHNFAKEDRKEAAEALAALHRGLEENTAITRQVNKKADDNGRKAEAAYTVAAEGLEAANNVNAKIAKIAEAALSINRATAVTDAASARADAAGIREAIANLGDKK